jgi:hypothetical protein
MGVYRVFYAFVKYILKSIAAFLKYLLLQLLLQTLLGLLIRAVRHILRCCRGRQVTPSVASEEEEGGPTTTTGIPRECHVDMLSILDSVRLSEEASAGRAADSPRFEDVPLHSPAHLNPSSSRSDVFIV